MLKFTMDIRVIQSELDECVNNLKSYYERHLGVTGFDKAWDYKLRNEVITGSILDSLNSLYDTNELVCLTSTIRLGRVIGGKPYDRIIEEIWTNLEGIDGLKDIGKAYLTVIYLGNRVMFTIEKY